MINEDQITLAELVAKIAKGHVLTFAEEIQVENLLNKYPNSKSTIQSILKTGEIEVPFDLSEIDVDIE